MISLVYVSRAAAPFSNLQLVELLEKCRENNESFGVTGILLYKDGRFMQALEGDEDAVRSVMAKISADPRHGDIAILVMEPALEREFAEWSMGFANLHSPGVLSIPGYSKFLETPLSREGFKPNPAGAKEVLLLFRKAKM
ncbi:MAG TPA: BLUF domain-containing protein [Verrucomicrobiae bacterium]|nr:BLUF domain-containing protein [Verrucomicrobiae bacterium]